MAKISAVKGNNKTVGGLTVSLLLRSIVALIIAGVVVISVSVVATGICTEEVGYIIKKTEDEGVTYTDVYTHYYVDGEDARFSEFDGKEGFVKQLIRGNVNDPKNPAMDFGQMSVVMWISQVLTLVSFVGLIYAVMWAAGDSDADKTELGNATFDKFKGIKVGLLADIPFIISYIGLVVTRALGVLPGYITFYKLFNGFALGLNHSFLVPTETVTPLALGDAVWLAVGLLIIPVTAAVSYLIGSKHIIIKNKIVYKEG